ncbi:hypothetical protein BFW01_g619 [Lasiodiplodia theobromae]|nr:hypothetical protein BFW01_g619 [Lasiodiplodia theobromae]
MNPNDFPPSGGSDFPNTTTWDEAQAANITLRTPGLDPAGNPLPDDVFSLYELVTCALASRAWPNHHLFFKIADDPASHADMQEFADNLRRRRADKVYDRKLFTFLRDLAIIQHTMNPGPSTEEAFLHADGVVDRAREVERGLEELLQKVKEEKMRPAVGRKGVGKVEGEQKKVVAFPGDLSAVRRAIDESFKDVKFEDEGEKGEEDMGQEGEKEEKKEIKKRKGKA